MNVGTSYNHNITEINDFYPAQNKNFSNSIFNKLFDSKKGYSDVMETYKKMYSKYNHKGKVYLNHYLNSSSGKKNSNSNYNDSFINKSIFNTSKRQDPLYNNFTPEPAFSNIGLIKDSPSSYSPKKVKY